MIIDVVDSGQEQPVDEDLEVRQRLGKVLLEPRARLAGDETLAGDISGWTVTAYPGDRGIYRLFVEDNKVKLEISAAGLSLIFR